MAKCKHCGAELPEGAKVCSSCKFEVDQTSNSDSNHESNNKVANVLRIIGLTIIFLGINFGVIAAVYVILTLKTKYTILVGVGYGILIILGSIVSGYFYLGFSEVINLLQSIKDKK